MFSLWSLGWSALGLHVAPFVLLSWSYADISKTKQSITHRDITSVLLAKSRLSMNAFKLINLAMVICPLVKKNKIKGGSCMHTPLIFVMLADEFTLSFLMLKSVGDVS